ncbi:MAG TPA: PepSY domain-containing protein [Acidobacteriaceae bacterium]|jgi:hypothetical protein|nr:PepSY domain-containing protein [Acidobacteriaceae bacterium]
MSVFSLRLFRKTHLYFGLFIAPALLFFAFTGSMQTLSLHEAAGRSYAPPHWLAELSQLHKKQTLVLPQRRTPPPAAAESAGRPKQLHDAASPAAAQPPVTLEAKQLQHLPMKIFFLVVALGLFSSTLTGIYMAYTYERSRIAVSGTLLAGVLVPLLLLKL